MARFLKDCSGVIHVGANSGQERHLYAQHRLPVIWIEPLDAAFKSLLMNIRNLPDQTAIKALVTDRDGDRHILHIASNDGASSSILDFNQVNDIWPDIHYVDKVEVQSSTLPTALAGTDWTACNALVLDTQGTELLILKGAEPILKHFKYIKTEAADFELYKDCCHRKGRMPVPRRPRIHAAQKRNIREASKRRYLLRPAVQKSWLWRFQD